MICDLFVLHTCMCYLLVQPVGEFPRHPSSDRFILSKVKITICVLFMYHMKGHAAPVLYAAWAEAGVIPMEELKNLRKIDSELEGHPTPVREHINTAVAIIICSAKVTLMLLLVLLVKVLVLPVVWHTVENILIKPATGFTV